MSEEFVRYLVDVDGRQWEVVIGAGTGAMTVDGEPLEIDLAPVGEAEFSALVGRRSVILAIQEEDEAGGYLVADGQRTYDVRVRDKRETRRARAGAGGELGGDGHFARASMPGIVTQVRVAEGDEVEVGQPLLILEAMKMENEICAVAAGRITQVHVTVGKSVTKGDILVAIEPTADAAPDSAPPP